MRNTTINVSFNTEKLDALKFHMEKRDTDLQGELNDTVQKLYEKYVPQAVREYIESRGDVPAAIKKGNKNTVRNTESSDQSE